MEEKPNKDQFEQVTDKILKKLEERFEKEQQKPFQYVVGYYKVKDDKLIGYHADSFCSLVREKEQGKRYNGEDPYSQLAIIRKNLDSLLDPTGEKEDGLAGLFSELTNRIKEKFYKGYSKEDIYINAEYLDENIPPQKFVYKVI